MIFKLHNLSTSNQTIAVNLPLQRELKRKVERNAFIQNVTTVIDEYASFAAIYRVFF